MKKINYYIKIEDNIFSNEFVSDAKNFENLKKEIELDLFSKLKEEHKDILSKKLNLNIDNKTFLNDKELNIEYNGDITINLKINHFGKKIKKNRLKNG